MTPADLDRAQRLLGERRKFLSYEERPVPRDKNTLRREYDGEWIVGREYRWDGERGFEKLVSVPQEIISAIIKHKLAEIERDLALMGVKF